MIHRTEQWDALIAETKAKPEFQVWCAEFNAEVARRGLPVHVRAEDCPISPEDFLASLTPVEALDHGIAEFGWRGADEAQPQAECDQMEALGADTATDVPMCPHCQSLDTQWADGLDLSGEHSLGQVGTIWETDCPNCFKHIAVSRTDDALFVTRKA